MMRSFLLVLAMGIFLGFQASAGVSFFHWGKRLFHGKEKSDTDELSAQETEWQKECQTHPLKPLIADLENKSTLEYLATKDDYARLLKDDVKRELRHFLNEPESKILTSDSNSKYVEFNGLMKTRKITAQPIYYVEFKNSAIEGLAFDRLEIFAELRKGRIFDDSSLRKILSNSYLSNGSDVGYDFKFSDVARFFSVAKERNIELNPLELRIRDDLLKAHIVEKSASGFRARQEGALLSSPKEASQSTLEHELNHGVYFTDPKYTEAVNKFWDELDPKSKALVKKAMNAIGCLGGNNFSSDKDFEIREFAAYFQNGYVLINSYLGPTGAFSQDDFRTLMDISLKFGQVNSKSTYYKARLQDMVREGHVGIMGTLPTAPAAAPGAPQQGAVAK